MKDDGSACFDEAIAERIVIGPLASELRAAYIGHADTCDACLERLARATNDLVSRGPEPSEASEREAPGRLFAGRYVILDTLGRGGMGVVYLAHDNVLGREVALKVVHGAHARMVDMIRGEARALASIQHANVVTVFDLVVDGDRLAIAMERVRGMTLRERMRHRPMTRAALVRALLAVGEGVAVAHAAGVVHGDIKLDNVLVDEGGHVRIADFGLSRLLGSIAAAVGGTRLFLAPETEDGADPTPASDQFALGACWVDALTDQRPTRASEWPTLTRRLRPWWARKPLRRALAPAVADRFPSVALMIASLRRRRAAFAGGVAALVVMLTLGPWATLAAVDASAEEACVDAATLGLADSPSVPRPEMMQGELGGRAWLVWARGVLAYAAWRARWSEQQRLMCVSPAEAPMLAPCLGVERRWIRYALDNVEAARAKAQLMGAMAGIELVQRENLCADANERAALTRFEATEHAQGPTDLASVLTLALGRSAALADMDAIIARLGPQPSRLLVLALLDRSATCQRLQLIPQARADAERAMELAMYIRQPQLQSAVATELGAIALQDQGGIAMARFWARVANALSTASMGTWSLRATVELEASIALASGRNEDIVIAVDRLLADSIGVFAVSPRLLTMRGTALVELGDLAAAEPSLLDSLDLRLTQVQIDPSRIAGAVTNLALLAQANDDHFGAFTLYQDATRLRAYLPEGHPDRLRLEQQRIAFDAEIFQSPDALDRAERVLTLTEARFPDDHVDSVGALGLVADVARRFGDTARAHEAASAAAERVALNDLHGAVGALPYLVLAELGDQPRASLEQGLTRLGAVSPSAPLCHRVRRLAASLGVSAGACAAR